MFLTHLLEGRDGTLCGGLRSRHVSGFHTRNLSEPLHAKPPENTAQLYQSDGETRVWQNQAKNEGVERNNQPVMIIILEVTLNRKGLTGS